MSALGMAQKFQLSFPTAQRSSGIVQIEKNHVQHIGIGSSIAAGFPNGAIEDRQAGITLSGTRYERQARFPNNILPSGMQHCATIARDVRGGAGFGPQGDADAAVLGKYFARTKISQMRPALVVHAGENRGSLGCSVHAGAVKLLQPFRQAFRFHERLPYDYPTCIIA